MKKTSLSVLDFQENLGDREAIDLAVKLGLDGIDFDLAPNSVDRENSVYSLGIDKVREYYSSLGKYAEEKGIKVVQTHGRFLGYGSSPEGNELFVKNSELDMVATAALGAKYTVFHTPAINHIGDRPDEELYSILTGLCVSVLPYAEREGVNIALETHGTAKKYNKMEFFGIPEHLLEGIRRAKEASPYGDRICVCVDTGHTNLATTLGYPSVGDVIRQLGSLVKVLHLHDNNGIRDQHKMLLTGDIDWNDTLAALDEIGFDGYYNLETMLLHFGKELMYDEADMSVKILKNLLKG